MELRRVVFLFFIFGYIYTGYAQNSPDSLYSQAQHLKGIGAYDSSLVTAQDAVLSFHQSEEWSAANEVLSFIVRLPYEHSQIAKFSDFIVQQSEYLKPINPIESANLLSYIASWHVRNGHLEESLEYYKQSANALYALNDTQYLHKVYYWLAQNIVFARSNGAEALIYTDQAKRIFDQKKIKNKKFLGKLEYIRGLAYRASDNLKAIAHFKKAQHLNGDSNGKLENNITKALLNLHQSEDAYISAKKASASYVSIYGEEDAEYLIYEALALHQLGQNNLALATIDKSLVRLAKYYQPTEPDYIKVFYYKAHILNNAGLYEEALENCQKVFSLSIPNYIPKSNTDVPDISEMTTNHWVLDVLQKQGEILLNKYHKTSNKHYLLQALNTYQKGIKDVETRRELMKYWDSKEQYNQFLYKMYEQALIVSALLYQCNSSIQNKAHVLFFLDKSKSTLLQDNFRERNKSKKIPVKILAEEDYLLQSIANIETEILKEKSKQHSTKIKILQNVVFDLRQTWKDFKIKHSLFYFPNSTEEKTISPDDRIATLPYGTAIIAYQLNSKHILAIGMNKAELYVQFIPRSTSFDSTLQKMHKVLSDWKMTLTHRVESEDSISRYAQYLSSSLLELTNQFSDKPEHLIIMPDELLHNVPFELLSVPGEDLSLIHKYNISYAYTFSSFPTTDIIEDHQVSFAGFAPRYNIDSLNKTSNAIETPQWLALRSGLMDIPEARKSVRQLAQLYNGAFWIEEQATKARFKKEAKHFDVLHLSMHGKLNEQSSALSHLVFSGVENNKLHLREIKSMDIPAKMVVLSACNTGIGRIMAGEGLYSLSQAFFYAGTKSTLMSLWQVPDEQTSRIMKLFYKNLEIGMNKSKALTLAKRQYLLTASTLESHPAFWSGFVLVGDSSPLQIRPIEILSFSKMMFFLIIILIFIYAPLVWVKRRQ